MNPEPVEHENPNLWSPGTLVGEFGLIRITGPGDARATRAADVRPGRTMLWRHELHRGAT